jgi:hypothetical protein
VVTVTFVLVKDIVAMDDGDQEVSTIPAGATIQTVAPIPDIGIIRARDEGRLTKVLAGDLKSRTAAPLLKPILMDEVLSIFAQGAIFHPANSSWRRRKP